MRLVAMSRSSMSSRVSPIRALAVLLSTCQVPASMETGFSPADGLPGGLVDVVEGLVLHGWNEPELAVEAAVVIPVDVLGYGDLQIVEPLPGPFVTHEFGLEQRIERLGHRIIVGIAD